MTPHWSASFRTGTSLLTDRRLRRWLSGAVLTTWSLTCSKQWRWSWASGEPPALPPLSGVIQIPGHHNFSGPEVGQSHWVHGEKGPAEAVLPLRAEEVQPATGAIDIVLHCHHWIRPLHVNNCLVQLSYQTWLQKTMEGSPDCWVNHWYNPPHSPGTVLIQSELKGCQNHSGPLTSSTLPLRTFTVWSTLQSSEHQNAETVSFPKQSISWTLDIKHGTHNTFIQLFIHHTYLYFHFKFSLVRPPT